MTVKKFFAGLLMIIGGLMAILTGGCTLYVLMIDPTFIIFSMPIGGIPFLIFLGWFFIGKNWLKK